MNAAITSNFPFICKDRNVTVAAKSGNRVRFWKRKKPEQQFRLLLAADGDHDDLIRPEM